MCVCIYLYMYLLVQRLLAKLKTIQTRNLVHIQPLTLSKNVFFEKNHPVGCQPRKTALPRRFYANLFDCLVLCYNCHLCHVENSGQILDGVFDIVLLLTMIILIHHHPENVQVSLWNWPIGFFLGGGGARFLGI